LTKSNSNPKTSRNTGKNGVARISGVKKMTSEIVLYHELWKYRKIAAPNCAPTPLQIALHPYWKANLL
jgi:hypothetical protein